MTEITRLVENFPLIENGPSKSFLDGVLFYKETQPIPRRPMVYNPGLCIVLQGHKVGYFFLGGSNHAL